MKGMFIPNKEMPDKCINCPCYDGEFNICQVTGEYSSGEYSWCYDRRPDTCPIVGIEINEKIEKGEMK